MIIRIDKGFMVELQKKGYDLDYRNLAEVYQTFRQRLGEIAEGTTSTEGEEEASESQIEAPCGMRGYKALLLSEKRCQILMGVRA